MEKIERLLKSLPTLQISSFPSGTRVPNVRKVSPLLDYNGFDGFERNRTWEVCKWLMNNGHMPKPCTCDICSGEASQYHAENYFDFSKYVPLCKSCHTKVHNRLKNFDTWRLRVMEFAKPQGHWIHLLEEESLPVAEWCARNGMREPTFADFVAKA